MLERGFRVLSLPMALDQARVAIIKAEYTQLCHVLGLREVPLDIYHPQGVDDDGDATTSLGLDARVTDAAYSGVRKLLLLPLCPNDLPEELPDFPPATWEKPYWQAWRIDLWHEVVHQVSDEVLNALKPNEPGYTRADGSMSQPGHGEGFKKALEYVAAKVGTDRRTLELLLDQ
jgi:hypothetical protein